jgi:serpin B
METPTADKGVRKLATGFNHFAFRLYTEIAGDGNCFFSPLSVGVALSALVPGARGATGQELAQLLQLAESEAVLLEQIDGLMKALTERRTSTWELDEKTSEFHEVEEKVFVAHIANALFVQAGYPLLSPYQKVLRSAFRAELASVDFGQPEAAASKINDWVSENTNGKITQLVSPDVLTDLTRLILTNAVYFYAGWVDEFSEGGTERRPFYTSPAAKERVYADMMRKTTYLPYMSDDRLTLQATSLGYRGNMEMLVVLPEPGRLSDVEAVLDADQVSKIVVRLHSRRLALEFPKFEMETRYELTGPLGDLGLRSAFDRESADFGGISDDPQGLFVSDVVHKARIRVDEQGTEAAAATMLGVLAAGVEMEEEEPLPFVVDRPFIFCIRDLETQAILFLGRVTDPSA